MATPAKDWFLLTSYNVKGGFAARLRRLMRGTFLCLATKKLGASDRLCSQRDGVFAGCAGLVSASVV